MPSWPEAECLHTPERVGYCLTEGQLRCLDCGRIFADRDEWEATQVGNQP